MINSLTKACKLINDQIKTRLPIEKSMLGSILWQADKTYKDQPYLRSLHKTLISTAYFGLFRLGELALGEHPVLARDVHISFNKRIILFILRTSKTHWKNMRPQTITVSLTRCKRSVRNTNKNNNSTEVENPCPCPYELLREYFVLRGPYCNDRDPFFVYSDGSPVTPEQFRKCLKSLIKLAGFKDDLYSVHSLRMGHAVDLLKLGVLVETIKLIGRWKSNAVFRYLK